MSGGDVFLDLGELDAAAEAFQPVLDLPQERRLHTLTSRISRFVQPLAAGQYAGRPMAQSLREQIATFTGEPLPAAR